MFIFLSACSLLVPLSMIILGYTWKDKPPKDRQGSSGYRTTMSRMNDFEMISVYLVFLQLGIMVLTIIPTEFLLHKHFTK